MKLKGKNIMSLVIYLFLVIIGLILSFINFDNEILSLKFLGIITTFELVAFLIANKTINKKILNYSTIFILVLFLFNFGQLLLLTFFNGLYKHVRFLLLLSNKESLYGFRLINIMFVMICLGSLIAMSIDNKKNDKDDNNKDNNNIKDNEYISEQKINKILLFTFPVKLLIDLICVYITFTKGGTATRVWLNSFPNIIVYFGKVSLIGFCLKILSNKDDPIKQKRIFYFVLIYLLIMMLSGIRSENVAYVLIVIFVYLANHKNPQKKNFALYPVYAIAGILLINFIITVGPFRNNSDMSLTSFFSSYNYYLTQKNPIFYLMDICGDTGYTAQSVLNKWLPYYDISYGNAYYLGLFAIIPNVPIIFDLPGKITRMSCFALKLQEYHALSYSYVNIGGSLIGELFFNFGIIGGFFGGLIIGMLVGVVSKKSRDFMESNDIISMIKYFPIMFAMIYWIRDYFGGGIREVIWGPLICWIIINLKANKSNENI